MASSSVMKHALAGGLKTLLRKRSFDDITVADICNASEISRRSFYRYFQDKYDLLNWLYDDEFCSTVDERPDRTIWDYYPDICRHLYSDREFYLHAFSFTGQNSFREFCTSKLYPLLMNDFGQVFSDEKVAHFVIDRITSATFDGFQWWLRQDLCMPPDEYAAFSQKIIMDVAKGISMIGKDK